MTKQQYPTALATKLVEAMDHFESLRPIISVAPQYEDQVRAIVAERSIEYDVRVSSNDLFNGAYILFDYGFHGVRYIPSKELEPTT